MVEMSREYIYKMLGKENGDIFELLYILNYKFGSIYRKRFQ